MILNRNLFQKKDTPFRVHMEDSQAVHLISEQLISIFPPIINRDLIIVCIGTDRSTGDSLGPLIGSKLEEQRLSAFHVYGTLENPVHAMNLEDTLKLIEEKHRRPFIIGIDACLGRMNSVGKITVAQGPIKPGAAVNKNLPEVGDVHVTGIVNIGGMMEYFVLQNTRLHTVMKMATIIAESLRDVDKMMTQKVTTRPRFFPSLKTNLFKTEKKEPQL
ncbi:spore protease YyaC [Alkalihalobacterium bogoriense]|uniref:spore protease YyaC n=1 Tax=Alkalihalobacterium bogoriense TaxID=246272 RepID=UPI00047BF019|nr:spore protease YyaC [Alkalihalobacterium bogoriense]